MVPIKIMPKNICVLHLSVPFLPTLAIPPVQDLKGRRPKVCCKKWKETELSKHGNGKLERNKQSDLQFQAYACLFGHLK